MKAPRRLVLVEWHDALHQHHGWADMLDFKHDDDRVRSVGWLLRRNRKSITLAQTDGGDNVANTIQIPARMVKRLVVLKVPR